ncbi:MAG: radical SAM protein [Candidatus Woesearchaeota archaeon]
MTKFIKNNAIVLKSDSDNPTTFLTLGGICNNCCVGCSTPSENYNSLSTKKILLELKKCKRQGYKEVHFFGGEITLRKDFFKLITFSKKLFDSVAITSNGRMFHYNLFVQKIAKLDISLINISLHGHDAKTHELWTKTPGSFEQTVNGIKNLIKNNVNVNINCVLWRGNYKHVNNFLDLLLSLNVKSVVFLNINPIGFGQEKYNSLTFNLEKLDYLNKSLLSYKNNFNKITLEDFPFCTFSYLIHNSKNIKIVNSSGNISIDNNLISSYGAAYLKQSGIDIFSNINIQDNIQNVCRLFNIYVKKIEKCKECIYENKCNGIFNDYIEFMGYERLQNQINNLFNKNIKGL